MDHKTKGKNLARSNHQKQMMANLVSSLIREGKVDTTVAKAKEARRFADKMVTLGKKGDPHHRRQAFKFLQDTEAVSKLFDTVAEEYTDREGG